MSPDKKTAMSRGGLEILLRAEQQFHSPPPQPSPLQGREFKEGITFLLRVLIGNLGYLKRCSHSLAVKLKSCLQLARPRHYVKNGFVWLPVFFGYKLTDLTVLGQALLAFLAFCLAASSVYVLNDLKDVEEDRRHPIKRFRPLASNALTAGESMVFMTLLLALSGAASYALKNPGVWGIIGAYLILNISYSFFLKRLAIIDVVCVALGFVLRVAAGGVAASVPISHWIIIMTFLLALFLAFAKRRDDFLLAANGTFPRRSLDGYSLEFISTSMAVMAAAIIVAYLLYTLSPEVISKHGTDKLYLTGFWVILGLLRFLQITLVKNQTGSPTQILLEDRFLQAVIGFWILSFIILLYDFGGK
jgi:4-hydroxybenzoate polyprenyltransferase